MLFNSIVFGILRHFGVVYFAFFYIYGYSFDQFPLYTICRSSNGHFEKCLNKENYHDKELKKLSKLFHHLQCHLSNFSQTNRCFFTNFSDNSLFNNGNISLTDMSDAKHKSKLFQFNILFFIVYDNIFSKRFSFIIMANNSAQNHTMEINWEKLTNGNGDKLSQSFQKNNVSLRNYLSGLTEQFYNKSSNERNRSGTIVYFLFPKLNLILQFAGRHIEMQLTILCKNRKFPSIDVSYSDNVVNTLKRWILTTKKYLESNCFFNISSDQENVTAVLKSDDPAGSHVTILVPIVIIGFIVFSCILIMRFCQDGESTLMMRAKIMKYHPEKDKQLLNLIYQQIHKEEQKQIAVKSNEMSFDNHKKSHSKYSLNSKNNESKKMWMSVSQPCCSKDLISAPLVSTIACGLAPLKRAC